MRRSFFLTILDLRAAASSSLLKRFRLIFTPSIPSKLSTRYGEDAQKAFQGAAPNLDVENLPGTGNPDWDTRILGRSAKNFE